jgi:hypothetical protein
MPSAQINQYIAQRAELLADGLLARLDTIRTPARRAQAMRSALRKLRMNEIVFSQMAGGINLRRALISGYASYIRGAAGIGPGLGNGEDAEEPAPDSWEVGVEQAGDALDLIDRIADTAGSIGNTVADMWGAFGGGDPPPPPPPPRPDPVKIAQLAPGAAYLRRIGRLQRVSAPGANGGITAAVSGIPTWALVGGAAALAGGAYYLLVAKKKPGK